MSTQARASYGGGSIKQTGPNRFQIRWSDGADLFTGKHRRRAETLTGVTKTEARRILAERVGGRGRGSDATLADVLSLVDRLAVADATRSTYRYALAHIPPSARSWRCDDIRVTDAVTLFDGLADRNSAQMVAKIRGALMACWSEARRLGWVDEARNPFAGLRLPAIAKSAGQSLTSAEVDAVVAAVADEIERAWLLIHLVTGARPGEVVALRWSALQLEADPPVIVFTDEKHGGKPRPVIVTPAVAAAIKSWQRCQRERALASGAALDADPWLISRDDPSSSVPERRAYSGRQRWQALRDRAGIRPSLRLYDLRHTANDIMGEAGIDARTRGLRLGNSAAVNEAVYRHTYDDVRAAQVMRARFG